MGGIQRGPEKTRCCGSEGLGKTGWFVEMASLRFVALAHTQQLLWLHVTAQMGFTVPPSSPLRLLRDDAFRVFQWELII